MANERRLIDAHDLWTDIMMLPHNGDMISSEEVEQAIKDAPTVEAVPVVHGEWIEDYETFVQDNGYESEPMQTGYICSECGKDGFPNWNYCPNCGAKMDGERKDNE